MDPTLKRCILLLLLLAIGNICRAQNVTISATREPELRVSYVTETRPIVMNMSSSCDLVVKLAFRRDLWPSNADKVSVLFRSVTIVPQFNILSLDSSSRRVFITRKQLEAQNYSTETRLKLYANYIGHAIVEPISLEFEDAKTRKTDQHHLPRDDLNKLSVTIVQFEGIWGTIFIVSVSIFMIISYVNLGAQLDTDNIAQMIKNPTAMVLGCLIGILIMPLLAWFVSQYFFADQLLYRVGSFIFACGPAASASTLWTAMLNSDKELSVGLQVLSSVSAIVSMPALLYYMDTMLNLENANFGIQVPYRRLITTMLVLLVALFVGWKFVGHNERAQKFSRKIFRPLTFFVLLFIIVFSSIIYWHIYQMFDLKITIASLIITSGSYVVTALLGYLVSFNFDQTVAICISGTYKNSGIAFAVLLVTFGAPDTYIAYVPCLMQIVLTSLSLYLFYSLMSLAYCIRRRYQLIEAPAAINCHQAHNDDAKQPAEPRWRQGSDRSTKSDENDEFIAMNVTDAPVQGEPQAIDPAKPSDVIQVDLNIVDGRDETAKTSEKPVTC